MLLLQRATMIKQRIGLSDIKLSLAYYAAIPLRHYASYPSVCQSVVSQKRCKIGSWLLLITNRKSHPCFRLVPKSTTLDDLERQLATLFQKYVYVWVFHENLNEIDPYCQQEKCRSVTLLFDNIKFMGSDIRGGFLGIGRQTTVGLSKRRFWGFRTLRLRHLRKWGLLYYIEMGVPRRLSDESDPKTMTLNGYFTLSYVFAPAVAVLAQKFWGGGALPPSAPSSPSPFSPFSETEKIRTSYGPFEIYH